MQANSFANFHLSVSVVFMAWALFELRWDIGDFKVLNPPTDSLVRDKVNNNQLDSVV